MGAATEQHAIPEIIEKFGGLLRTLEVPSSETFSNGNLAGQITDDTSQMFALAQTLIDTDGELTEAAWIKRLFIGHRHRRTRTRWGRRPDRCWKPWRLGRTPAR